MIISRSYSFNGGERIIKQKYPHLLTEIEVVIELIDAESCRLKDPEGKERLRLARIGEARFYSPSHLNALFDYFMLARGWDLKPRIRTNDRSREGYREMDAVKDRLGVEMQFGKYAFLTYDIVAKMVIFRNQKIIDAGIEICPMASMLPHLSSGIGAFEQVAWDLAHRGAHADFDVPVLVLGIETDKVRRKSIYAQAALDSQVSEPISQVERSKVLNEGTIKKIRETGLDPRIES